jgi:transcriptional regulator GlxA family with amidase domain
MLKFGVLVYEGFDELDAIAVFEVLRLAQRLGAELETQLVRASDSPRIRAHHGAVFDVETRFDALALDWLIVPGGGWAARSAAGAWAEFQRGDLPLALAAANARGVKVASVCTGAMLLAKAGLTRGRPVTTHRCARAELEASGARLIDARVVDDGDLITAGGVVSGLDLGIWLVERFVGNETRTKVELALEYTSVAKVWQKMSPPPVSA